MYGSWLTNLVNKTIEFRRNLNRGEIEQAEFLNQYTALSDKPAMDKMRNMIKEIEQIDATSSMAAAVEKLTVGISQISSMVFEIQNITQGAVKSMDTSVQLVQEGID